MNRFLDFIMAHWQTIALIYCIVAAIVFVAVLVVFMWAAKAETEESERYPEYYDCGEHLNTASALLISLIAAICCAVLWVAIPLLMLGLYVYTAITERFPELMGDMADDNTENEERTEE